MLCLNSHIYQTLLYLVPSLDGALCWSMPGPRGTGVIAGTWAQALAGQQHSQNKCGAPAEGLLGQTFSPVWALDLY